MNLGEKRWEKVKAFRIKVVENENVVIWKKVRTGRKKNITMPRLVGMDALFHSPYSVSVSSPVY